MTSSCPPSHHGDDASNRSDRPPREGDNAVAALVRAALGRFRRVGRLPSRTVATATDRLATALDVAESVAAKGGLRALMGGGVWAFAVTGGSVVVSLGKATVAGTVLFSVFDEVAGRGARFVAHSLFNEPPRAIASNAVVSLVLPFFAGAIAGACFGGTVVLLDGITAGRSGLPLGAALARGLHSFKRELPPVAVASAVEWGAAFGSFILLQQVLMRADTDPVASHGPGPNSGTSGTSGPEPPFDGGAISLARVAALAAAAAGGGVAQVSAAGVMADGWRNAWRALTPKSVGVASVGLAAYELAHFLE